MFLLSWHAVFVLSWHAVFVLFCTLMPGSLFAHHRPSGHHRARPPPRCSGRYVTFSRTQRRMQPSSMSSGHLETILDAEPSVDAPAHKHGCTGRADQEGTRKAPGISRGRKEAHSREQHSITMGVTRSKGRRGRKKGGKLRLQAKFQGQEEV